VAELRRDFESPGANRWAVRARGGGQAYTTQRRDPLHPTGPTAAQPYADLRAEAVIGSLALATRPAAEPRIVHDPEWPGRRDLRLAWRFVEGYVSAQFRYASLFYGQLDRNWGPVGLPGIGVSDYGYPMTEAGFTVGTRTLQLHALARDLRSERDTAGALVRRYFFAHRLGVRVTPRLHLGVWETTVLAGVDRDFDSRYRNPLTLLVLANQYGLGADGNVLLGLDAHWRVGRRLALAAQLGLDDLQYEAADDTLRYPGRWAVTLAASGALGRALGWRALYTRATSLAFRTADPFESFTDAGVGLGRNWADLDQATIVVSVPVVGGAGWGRWLLTPELTLLRQGEGRIGAPFPATAAEAGRLPEIFVGTVERTWRLALGVSGYGGPLELRADAGLHQVSNAGHVPGRDVTRFEGRLQATVGIGAAGVLR
jgi:hypothetical protein